MSTKLASPAYIDDLGDGLLIRWSTAADTEKIGLLLSTVHRDSADEPLNIISQDLARTLMRGNFPFMDAGDFAVVEDSSRPERPIVACTCLWRHPWRYANIPLTVGRPEYVATDPAYRNRGLVRRLFDLVHARSATEGHLLQAITGITYFYRQFSYEYVLDLEGCRTVYFAQISDKTGDDPEPYQLRPATLADIPLLQDFYNQQRSHSLLWHEPSEAYWRWIINYWADPAVQSRPAATLSVKGRHLMIVDNNQRAVGSTWVRTRRWGRTLAVVPNLSNAPDLDRPALVASLLRLLRDWGLQTPGSAADTPPCSELRIDLGIDHPLYGLIGDKVALRIERPYAWYVRVPDLPAFLRHITPVLEERLAQSVYAGYTGELKFDLHRGGLHFRFAQGNLIAVEPWRQPAYGDEAQAGTPPLLFLQLLLSYRSLEELMAFYPDVWANDKSKLLVNTLFPKLRSTVFEPLE